MATAPTTQHPAHPAHGAAGATGATGTHKPKAGDPGPTGAALSAIAAREDPTRVALAQYGPGEDQKPTSIPHGVISALARGASATGVGGAPMPPGLQLSNGNPNGTSFGQGPNDKISFYGGPGVAQMESKHVNVKQLEDPNFKPGADFMGEVAQALLAMGLIRPGRDPEVVAAEEKAKKEAEEAAAKLEKERQAAAGHTGATGATGPAR